VVCGCLLRTQQCVELYNDSGFVYASLFLSLLSGKLLLGQFLLESLILAQDERWRRA
jgi:hypothetical protein